MPLLRHGTTRQRAESIQQHGPDPDFVEPGGMGARAEGFSTCTLTGPFPLGTPEQYAHSKAGLFPNEGGAVILEVEVPTDIVDLACLDGGNVDFLPAGWGLDELQQAWPNLPKRIVSP